MRLLTWNRSVGYRS